MAVLAALETKCSGGQLVSSRHIGTCSRRIGQISPPLSKRARLFAHLKRLLKLGPLRLRSPSGAKDEFLLAATAQSLRKLAKLIPFPAPIFAT